MCGAIARRSPGFDEGLASMTDHPPDSARALKETCAAVIEWLRPRQAEIAQAIGAHIRDAVPSPVGGENHEYEEGLLTAVTAIISYSLDALEQGPGWSAPIPPAAAAQARRAARIGVSLGIVQRRYIAGHGKLGEFVTRGLEHNSVSNNGSAVQHLRRTQESLLEHLTAAIECEYNRELQLMASSPEQRLKDIVRRLLAGDLVEPTELAELRYDIHAPWHLGLVVVATSAPLERTIGRLKSNLGRRLLAVPQDDGIVLVWFAGQRKPEIAEIERMLSPSQYPDTPVAIGEPREGIDGWRQTHREAQAALLVASREPMRLARYAECQFLAAARQIDTLANSLQHNYLIPLRSERDGGATLRKTLRAWVDTDGYMSSAAKLLRVDRHTVENHLRTVEKLTGRPLRRSCLAELDVALRLEES
jgi:hypothetical protein